MPALIFVQKRVAMLSHLAMTVESGQYHHWEKKENLYALVNGEEAFFLKEGDLIKGDEDAFFALSTDTEITKRWRRWWKKAKI